MLSLSENPSILTPEVGSLTELYGTWWIAYTRPRFEKAFAHDMQRMGIGYYLPMIERVRVSGGRKRRVMAPLFVSYVFFCGSDEDRHAAMTTNRLCQAIEVPDQNRLVKELCCFEQALSGQVKLDPYPFAVVGHRCRVIAGPMIGLVGTVVRRDKLARLVLEVSMLGQGASLEIDCDLLEPTDD